MYCKYDECEYYEEYESQIKTIYSVCQLQGCMVTPTTICNRRCIEAEHENYVQKLLDEVV